MCWRWPEQWKSSPSCNSLPGLTIHEMKTARSMEPI